MSDLNRRIAVVLGTRLLTDAEMQAEALEVWKLQPGCRHFHMGFQAWPDPVSGEPVCEQSFTDYTGSLDTCLRDLLPWAHRHGGNSVQIEISASGCWAGWKAPSGQLLGQSGHRNITPALPVCVAFLAAFEPAAVQP